VHAGVEYGILAAYAEGLNILAHANLGKAGRAAALAEGTLRELAHYQYDFRLRDIAEVWRRRSAPRSLPLRQLAAGLAQDPEPSRDQVWEVPDSAEARWALQAAVDEGVPATVLGAALAQRFASRGADAVTCRALRAVHWVRGVYGWSRSAPGT